MRYTYLSSKRNRWYTRRKDYFSKCLECGKDKSKTPSKKCVPCRDRMSREPIGNRFFRFVKKTPSCWIWIGSKTKGYGQIYDPEKRRPEKAYRVSWELINGKIPEGKEILHNCPGGDNPSCVNPNHLKLGTHSENMNDAELKQQMVKGIKHPQARLTENNVRIIKSIFSECREISRNKIAKIFNVSPGTIQSIVEGKSWKHIR